MEQNYLKLEKLVQIAKQFTKEEYNLKLDIPIKINNRLKTTLGRYRATRTGEPKQIDVSGKLLTYADDRVAISVIKHEAVHFALNKLNKPYRDGEPYFENELIRLNLPSSTKRERAILFVGEKYIFHCKQCKRHLQTSIKRVKNKTNSYKSKCCNSEIQYVKTVISDGTDDGKCLFLND